MESQEYEIGGQVVYMTEAVAERWNDGTLTGDDEKHIEVVVPYRTGATSILRDGEVVVSDGLPCEKRVTLDSEEGAAVWEEYLEGNEANPV